MVSIKQTQSENKGHEAETIVPNDTFAAMKLLVYIVLLIMRIVMFYIIIYSTYINSLSTRY